METTFALHQWVAGDFVDEILQKESVNFVRTKVMFYYAMKSMFGMHYNLTRKYDMNTQRSANKHEPSKHHIIVPKLFLPQTSEITSRPARRSSMNSSSKIPAAQ